MMAGMQEELGRKLREQEAEQCPDCGKPEGSFACRVRHINISTEWAKGDH